MPHNAVAIASAALAPLRVDADAERIEALQGLAGLGHSLFDNLDLV